MKVPTYQKYGITKSELERFDNKNRNISHLLTHRIPIVAGIIIGLIFYILNFSRFNPSNVFQIASQIFLFVSIGILSIGLPMLIFKWVESYYYKRLEKKNETYRSILKFKKDKEEFDFWHIREDERFWKLVDGYSFEREIINIYKNLGYEVKSEIENKNNIPGYVLTKDGKNYFLKCITNKKIELMDEINEIIEPLKTNYDKFLIVISKGFKPELKTKLNGNVELMTVKDIIVMLKSINE